MSIDDDGTNPYETPRAFENAAASPTNLLPVGITLLGLSILYIFLMLLNLALYIPQTLSSSENTTFPATMCIYVLIVIAFNFMLITGAISILRRGSYVWALVTCCLAMVPMLGPCYILGIPVGIWGVVQLRKPGVRDSFRGVPYNQMRN